MADVTLSKAVRSNLLNLQSTAAQLGKTQERLATGLKVNSALDNPTNFFTSSSLNSRAGDLGRLLDAVGNATQTIEAANNGLSAITKLVESAQATARQALQTVGATTTNKIVGSTSATYNPQALTSVTGNNDATGTNQGTITADAAATVNSATIGADATIAVINTGDTTGATDDTTLLSAGGGAALANGESITFNVNGTSKTINFVTSGAADLTGTNTLTIGIDQQTGAFRTALGQLFSTDTAVGITVGGTNGALTLTSDATVNSIAVSDGAGNGTTLAKLNLAQADVSGETAISATAGDTGDYLLTKNADIQALAAAGATLSVKVGSAAAQTVTFGYSSGQVSTKANLISTLDGLTGVSASGTAGSSGAVTIANSNSTDADSSIVLTASDSTTATALLASLDAGSTVTQTAEATNLLSQGKATQGDTLNIKIGQSAQLNVTFGNGTGEISTIGELNAALQNLAGGAASIDSRGELNITTDRAGDTITIGGTTGTLANFGVTAGETSSLIDGTNIAVGDKLNIQIGTNQQLTVTFGTGTGQVNTLSELETALGNLAGGTATIDNQTGAVTIKATTGSDSITVTSTNSLDASKDSVAASFGLNNSTTPVAATTTDSASRATLETQYNDLLSQINQLSEDASFNGVNLLGGNDLNVIFNEDSTSKLDIKGVTFNASGLGLSRVASGSFQTDTAVNNTLTSLDSAINSLRSQATTFGSNLSVVETRQDFTKKMINTLETGASNLTLADTNEEAANLLALQTRQQLSSTALSLASQADQNVLRLF